MFIDFAFLSDTFFNTLHRTAGDAGAVYQLVYLRRGTGAGRAGAADEPLAAAERFCEGYILIFRGSPLLIQLFLIYYGLGQFGVSATAFYGCCCGSRSSARCWRWRCALRPIRPKSCAGRCWRSHRPD
ncbi:Inner membrane amino-acid ABC transporter permease protein yecS [Raoultella terrigena]|uniref:Inner membrane amino-acid ABC transporter permease protein yecS n=1 Tax=Raoultella terrigena TaxID=577 RepID=A0A4V6J154_RAOTE|nr:Inner membrane amino-acid ABC transporter permease protein yecS [Raoultella terrigena]